MTWGGEEAEAGGGEGEGGQSQGPDQSEHTMQLDHRDSWFQGGKNNTRVSVWVKEANEQKVSISPS